jgi:hypothetical protein
VAADLKLASFSDRELLHLLADLGDQEGWVELDHLVVQLNLPLDGMTEAEHHKHVRRCIGIRFGWIRRLTMTVERDKKPQGRWRLTVAGQEVVKARLTADFAAKLDGIGELTALPALEALTRRYMTAEPGAANLMRRQWQYGTHPNRRR